MAGYICKEVARRKGQSFLLCDRPKQPYRQTWETSQYRQKKHRCPELAGARFLAFKDRKFVRIKRGLQQAIDIRETLCASRSRNEGGELAGVHSLPRADIQ